MDSRKEVTRMKKICLFLIALVAFCYWLLKSKKISPVKVILIVAVVAFVLGAAGIVA